MTEYKGFDILIRAAKLLSNDTVVLIGGDGELLEAHRNLIVRLGLCDKVVLLGQISDELLPSYYTVADVFCLPSLSRNEAFGLVILEAMSYSKAVVATRIPGSGVSWVNVEGVTGLNAIPGDPEDLARCLSTLLEDAGRARLFGLAGRQRYETEFTADVMINGVVQGYEEIGVGSPV